MTHRILWLFALVLLTALPAHARFGNVPAAPADFPNRHGMFDYQVGWKVDSGGTGVTISGVLKNVRYASISDLQVTVYLVGRDRSIRARGTDIPIPQHSRQGELVPFQVKLKGVRLEQGDQLEFLIHYRGSDGQDDDNDWRSSFKADAATGEVLK